MNLCVLQNSVLPSGVPGVPRRIFQHRDLKDTEADAPCLNVWEAVVQAAGLKAYLETHQELKVMFAKFGGQR